MRPAKVLLYQSLGFLAIIALSWIDELVDLHTLILGNHPYISDFREATLEMLFVLTVWLLVCGSTRRLLARVRHLEGFMRVCSWCHRVGSEGRWIPVEQFALTKLNLQTSHGICEECLKKQETAMEGLRSKSLQEPVAKPAIELRKVV